MATSHRRLGLLLGFTGMCLFAGTLPATRLALSGFDAFFLTVARAALAGSAGLVLLSVMRHRIPPRSLWPELFGAALCTVVGFPLLAALAMVTVPAAHGGVVLGIIPLVEPKQFHDVVGYYNRFDVFDLRVNRKRIVPITFSDDDGDEHTR